jgi:hypothetical protein
MKSSKESKTILGTDIQLTDEKRTWRCTVKTGSGEIVTISFEVFSKLLADYNIEIEKLRNHYRAIEFTQREK